MKNLIKKLVEPYKLVFSIKHLSKKKIKNLFFKICLKNCQIVINLIKSRLNAIIKK